MFKKILYPTDFSDVSKRAMDFVKQLKDAGSEEVIILHVIDKSSLNALAMYTSKDFLKIEKGWEEKAEEDMRLLEKELKEKGFKVKARIEEAIPFREILRVEEEEDVSLIVIGSHGLSNIQEMFLGSVSEKVIRGAKKPVLVVKR